MKHRGIAVMAMVALLSCGAATQEASTAKQDDIKKIMRITGASNIALQFATMTSQNMFASMKSIRPDVPERALQIMERELLDMFSKRMNEPGGLMDQVVPVYDKYFSHAEIKDMIRFYETPTGKKTIAVLPQVMNECMAIGQQWGVGLAPEAQQRIETALKKENITIPEP